MKGEKAPKEKTTTMKEKILQEKFNEFSLFFNIQTPFLSICRVQRSLKIQR